MPYCSKCGAELNEDAKFCPKCGTPATTMVARPEGRIPRERRMPMSRLMIILIVVLVAVVVVAAVATALLLGGWRPFGHIVGSGDLDTEVFDLADFTAVNVGGGFEVEISQSSSYSIRITADDNMFDYIEVSKTDDTLTIRMKWGYSYESAKARDRPTKITMPALYELRFSGGTHGEIEDFSSSHEFAIGLSGGSSLNGDFTTSEDAQFDLSGGSTLSLNGAANDLTIDASSGSHLDLPDFTIQNATVDLSGGSWATINVDGRLDADLSGGSHLFYTGNPTMGNIDTSGGSTIEPSP